MSASETTRKFETGAVRSAEADDTRFDLISPIGLRRVAETYAEGAVKYGDRNWEQGFPVSCVLNHALRHVNEWLAGDRREDHLAHAAWNLFAAMHFEECLPELVDIPTRQQNSPAAESSFQSALDRLIEAIPVIDRVRRLSDYYELQRLLKTVQRSAPA